MNELVVAGAGAFGTALAISFASGPRPVTLWAHDPGHVAAMTRDRLNRKYLPESPFPDDLSVASDQDALSGGKTLVVAVPTQALRAFLSVNAAALQNLHLVLCCKGIEKSTGLLPSDIATEVLPSNAVSVLTGPGFASEISTGLPTALTLATSPGNDGLAAELAAPNLRLYLSHDRVGAQLGGALKNVVAIASGLAIGAGLGESARAAVMTRGFAEMSRLARALGAEPQTLSGLSGLGDLALTCTSHLSRNFSLGHALGQGGHQQKGVTYEGAFTAEATTVLAQKHGVEMPLSDIVLAILQRKLSIEDAVNALLSRPLRHEQE